MESHRDAGQPLVFRLAILAILALQNVPRGRSAEGVVGLIHGGQQFDIHPRVALRKAMAAIDDRPELALLAIALDQPRHLRAAQASHAGDVAAQQPTPLAALLLVLLLLEQLLDPVIDLLPALGFEPDLLAGL